MTTIEQLYERLAERLRAIPHLRAKPYVPGSTELPVAFPEPPSVELDNLANDTITVTFDLVVLVSAVEDRRINTLLRYQEPSGDCSITALLAKDRSLGLSDVHVHSMIWRPLGLQEMSYYRAFGASLSIQALLGDC